MKKLFSSRRTLFVWIFCILLAIIVVSSAIYAKTAYSQVNSQQRAGTTKSPDFTIVPGHYTVTTRFLAGPKAGQKEQGTYDIGGDGSLTVFFPAVGTGHGTIVPGYGRTYILTFREVIPHVGDIQVAQVVTTISKEGFTSQGFGQLYINGVPEQGSRNKTISVATIAPAN
jgi:hypothetical protein